MSIIIALVVAVHTEAFELSEPSQALQGGGPKVRPGQAQLQLLQLLPGFRASCQHRWGQGDADGALLHRQLLLEGWALVDDQAAKVYEGGQVCQVEREGPQVVVLVPIGRPDTHTDTQANTVSWLSTPVLMQTKASPQAGVVWCGAVWWWCV